MDMLSAACCRDTPLPCWLLVMRPWPDDGAPIGTGAKNQSGNASMTRPGISAFVSERIGLVSRVRFMGTYDVALMRA